jgi:hypothetical protein
VNVEPLPTSLSTPMEPPCAWMIILQVARHCPPPLGGQCLTKHGWVMWYRAFDHPSPRLRSHREPDARGLPVKREHLLHSLAFGRGHRHLGVPGGIHLD